MIKVADYIIDIGPEGGSGGGAVLYEFFAGCVCALRKMQWQKI